MRWIPLAVLVLTFSAAGAAPVPKHLEPKIEPFWPTAVGTKWVYEQHGLEWEEEITKAERLKGIGTRVTVRRSLLVGFNPEVLDVTPEGVTVRTIGKFTVGKLLVRLPLKENDSWTLAVPIQDGFSCEAGTITVYKEEVIKVPAGTFRATRVVNTITETDGKSLPKPFPHNYWYSKGVGMVKVEWEGGRQVLKSFTPGKK